MTATAEYVNRPSTASWSTMLSFLGMLDLWQCHIWGVGVLARHAYSGVYALKAPPFCPTLFLLGSPNRGIYGFLTFTLPFSLNSLYTGENESKLLSQSRDNNLLIIL